MPGQDDIYKMQKSALLILLGEYHFVIRRKLFDLRDGTGFQDPLNDGAIHALEKKSDAVTNSINWLSDMFKDYEGIDNMRKISSSMNVIHAVSANEVPQLLDNLHRTIERIMLIFSASKEVKGSVASTRPPHVMSSLMEGARALVTVVGYLSKDWVQSSLTVTKTE